MRKVRDYDAELKALGDKARLLKAKRVEQLGQLVAATEGLMRSMLKHSPACCSMRSGRRDAGAKEAWRAKGAAFFQRRGRKPVPSEVEGGAGAAAIDGSGAAAEPGGNAAGGSGGTANG